jgi:hypothetical protein
LKYLWSWQYWNLKLFGSYLWPNTCNYHTDHDQEATRTLPGCKSSHGLVFINQVDKIITLEQSLHHNQTPKTNTIPFKSVVLFWHIALCWICKKCAKYVCNYVHLESHRIAGISQCYLNGPGNIRMPELWQPSLSSFNILN